MPPPPAKSRRVSCPNQLAAQWIGIDQPMDAGVLVDVTQRNPITADNVFLVPGLLAVNTPQPQCGAFFY
jgi:hypothetical protein